MKRCLPKMWRSHTSLGESRHHWQRQHHLPKANIIEKRRLLSQSSFFLAGVGGLEPAPHGFGVAPRSCKALKLLAFLHVSTHFSSKITCHNCVWKFMMLFWWYDKISAYILAANVLLMLLKIWGAINKEEYLTNFTNWCIIHSQRNKRELVNRLRGRCDLRPRTWFG